MEGRFTRQGEGGRKGGGEGAESRFCAIPEDLGCILSNFYCWKFCFASVDLLFKIKSV